MTEQRKMVLTEGDLAALAKLLQEQHQCRFHNVSREDMDFVKDLLTMYKETRSEVLKWVVKGIVYATLLLILIGTYFKFNVRGH